MPVSQYTRERLEEAARTSRTLSEAMGRLGVDPQSGSRKYVRERMRKLDIDTSHFERDGVRWTKEVLGEAVAASTNMCEVLRRLGVEVVGGQHTHISRRVKAMGIDTSHFRLPSPAGRPKARLTPENLLVRQDRPSSRRRQSQHLKQALSMLGVPDVCQMCGIPGAWQGYPLPLEVDHLDGDWRNNLPENLRLLCPNCHSTTETYRGRGKGRRP
ncbi:HNH endonuclease signature motif containing protein [Streptomyces sp. NPDC089799]|uniref:HNH endonuclease signature motif containing protein n=1 Tax=Streptomyces sp. NPDC089799 TaxID=3155066 RepID=UPI00342910E9